MKFGFVRVCAATPSIRVADVNYNAEQIIACIKKSAAGGSQLTVFPELCVTGYTCGDLFNQKTLIDGAWNGLEKIAAATAGIKTLAFVGAPVVRDNKLYNCAVAVTDGKILGIVPKTYIPDYGEFYEGRHFSSAPESVGYSGETPFGSDLLFKCAQFTVAAEICEDLWAPLSPSVRHAQAGAEIIVNLSCSDETVGKADYRRTLIKAQSGKLVCGYVYCDAGDGESTTDMAFAGHNIICENGSILAQSKLFENGLVYGEIDVEKLAAERRKMSSTYSAEGEIAKHIVVGFETFDNGDELLTKLSKTPFVPEDGIKLCERNELILSIQSKGLEKRITHTSAKTAVIGISGGLDSALALLVTCRTFDKIGRSRSDIIAVTMPGFGTSGKTKSNSLQLINALGVTAKNISVKQSVLKHFADIGHAPDKLDVTYENAQARMRTLVLMDLANQSGGMVIGTGDLSELALGWATYNGDHMSMYGVNSSVPKTLVKHLIAYEAQRLGGKVKSVLQDIINTEISPELLPPDKNGNITQKTEDIVGPYILHDFFLYYAVRWGFTPEKIYYLAEQTFKDEFDSSTVKKWLKNFYSRFFSQQFKRSCMPDGVKVGSVSLSPRGDWRMPSDAVKALWSE